MGESLEHLDALRRFRQELEAIKAAHPELTTEEAQKRLRHALERHEEEEPHGQTQDEGL